MAVIMFTSWLLSSVVSLKSSGLFVIGVTQWFKDVLLTIFLITSTSALIIFLGSYNEIGRTEFAVVVGAFLILKLAAFGFAKLMGISAARWQVSGLSVLIIGPPKIRDFMVQYFQSNPSAGHIKNSINVSDGIQTLEESTQILKDVKDFLQHHPVQEAIISLHFSNEDLIRNIVRLTEQHGARTTFLMNHYSVLKRNFDHVDYHGLPAIRLRQVPLDSLYNQILKRTFDILFSLTVLILLTPVLLIISLAIVIDSGWPVFYKPNRIGKNGQVFKMFKFRSMYKNQSPGDEARSTTLNDERITRVGIYLRRFSLDELPQFLNVLLGDMSVVGPRPHRNNLHRTFQKIVTVYSVRQFVRPGITGWAQINGFRGPTEHRYQFIGRALHDVWYVEHWSFLLDIYIVLLTVFGKNARRNAF